MLLSRLIPPCVRRSCFILIQVMEQGKTLKRLRHGVDALLLVLFIQRERFFCDAMGWVLSHDTLLSCRLVSHYEPLDALPTAVILGLVLRIARLVDGPPKPA